MAVRLDVRLLDAPMEPVACRACGAQVEVRKSSWDQTSVQWNDEAVASCLERRAADRRPGPNGAVFAGCTALREAIREAAVLAEIHVQHDESQEAVTVG